MSGIKLYDLVKQTLEIYPISRDDDKELMWSIWEQLGWVRNGVITKAQFISKNFPTCESITRARRRVQELHPNLQASPIVQANRTEKELEKGMFVFHEKVQPPIKSNGTQGHFEIRDGREVFIKEATANLPSQGKS